MLRHGQHRPTTQPILRRPLRPGAAFQKPTSKPGISLVTSPKPSKTAIPQQTRKPRVRCLLIGNNYVGTSSELLGCYNDVKAIREFVSSQCEKHQKQALFFVLGDDKIERAPDGVGSGANILKGIAWLLSGAVAGDTLLVHYSGHGVALPALTDSSETFGTDSAWVPVDFATFRGGGRNGLITDDELRRALVAALPSGVRLWMTSDSCYSGSVLDLRFNYTDASFSEKTSLIKKMDDTSLYCVQALDSEEIIQFDSRSLQTASLCTENKGYPVSTGTVVLLSGCTDISTAADATGMSKPMGALTWALLNVLSKNAAVPLKYLIKDLRALIKRSGFAQVPQLSSGRPLDLNADSFESIVFL